MTLPNNIEINVGDMLEFFDIYASTLMQATKYMILINEYKDDTNKVFQLCELNGKLVYECDILPEFTKNAIEIINS